MKETQKKMHNYSFGSHNHFNGLTIDERARSRVVINWTTIQLIIFSRRDEYISRITSILKIFISFYYTIFHHWPMVVIWPQQKKKTIKFLANAFTKIGHQMVHDNFIWGFYNGRMNVTHDSIPWRAYFLIYFMIHQR